MTIILVSWAGWWLPYFAVRYAQALLQLYSANWLFTESGLLHWAAGRQPWSQHFGTCPEKQPSMAISPDASLQTDSLAAGCAADSAVFRVPSGLRLVVSGVLYVCASVLLFRFGLTLPFWCSLAAVLILLVLAIIDWQIMLLPDTFTIGLLWLGLLAHLVPGLSPQGTLPEAVLGAAAGYTVLALLFHVYRWIRQKDGMGQGDFKLMAALGAWFGWQALPELLLLACIGSVLYTVLCVARQSWRQPRPFGPFLVASGLLAFLGMPFSGS